jgi:hypothetical protein
MESAGLITGQAVCSVSAPIPDLEHLVLEDQDQLDHLAHPLVRGDHLVGGQGELQKKKCLSSWLSLMKWIMCMKNLKSWARGN